MKNDATLVAEALNNGPEAFAQIIEQYKSIVFGVAVARVRNFHDAEDLAHTLISGRRSKKALFKIRRRAFVCTQFQLTLASAWRII